MDETLTGAAQFQDDRLWIESLDIDAQGIAHRADGIVVFVEGALPFEQVSANTYRRKSSFHKATVTAIHRESSQRVVPGCPHFGLHAGACGGCKMQHLDAAAQVAAKQRVLEDNLWHLAKVKPENLLRPIHGPTWGYRYRARLSVRYVRKKDTVLIGFHERKSSFVADMRECRVLHPFVSALLMPLRELLMGLQARESCPQIELAVGDDAGVHVVALVLRHLEPLSRSDKDALRAFATCHSSRAAGRVRQLQWWLQPKGPETAALLDDDGAQLAYCLPEFGVRMPFKPTDFTQVNPEVNAVLVGYALRLLGARRDERVIDWFCGLGNFTLPLATLAGQVVGVEGSDLLVARARANALTNRAVARAPGKFAPTEFVTRNLFDMTAPALLADGVAQRWMLDPPREGALALVKALVELHRAGQPCPRAGASANSPDGESMSALDLGHWSPPGRIVYISCNPATLARDAGLLVHEAGYRCSAAGVVNMFAHTAHVESVAVFDRVPSAPPRSAH